MRYICSGVLLFIGIGLSGCFYDVDRTIVGLGQFCESSAECADYEKANFCSMDLIPDTGGDGDTDTDTVTDTETDSDSDSGNASTSASALDRQDSSIDFSAVPGTCTIKDCKPGECPDFYECCECPLIPSICVDEDMVEVIINGFAEYNISCSCS